MGTPYYLSPEQAEGGLIDERSDLYSVGATLYHCLVGKPVFTGKSVSEIFTKQVHQPPVPLLEAGATAAEGTAQVVMRLLRKNPEDRFQTAQELVTAITAVKQADSGAAVPAAEGAAPVSRRKAAARKSRAGSATATTSATSPMAIGSASPSRSERPPLRATCLNATRMFAPKKNRKTPAPAKKSQMLVTIRSR